MLPSAALDGTKDLSEYWQRFHTMPGRLVEERTSWLRLTPAFGRPSWPQKVGSKVGSAAAMACDWRKLGLALSPCQTRKHRCAVAAKCLR